MWQPSQIYPDPAVEVLDPRFAHYRISHAAIERLATGMRHGEGPVWFGDGRYLLWSDIPNNRMMRWDEETGAVSVFRKSSGFANGNTRDRQGRLITCEHGGRRVVRTEYDGRITVLVDRFEGKLLNSPNDVVVKSDDSIWFSDPTFGIQSDYEGHKAPSELPTRAYRHDPHICDTAVLVDDIANPNGLCFSPDEMLLYIVESSSSPRRIRVYDVVDNALKNGRIFVNAGPQGAPDGIRCDADGNIWAGWGTGPGLNGVRILRRTANPSSYPPSRALRQSVLWRPSPKAPVHGGRAIIVLAICGRQARRPLTLVGSNLCHQGRQECCERSIQGCASVPGTMA